jgi:hypothetical protein
MSVRFADYFVEWREDGRRRRQPAGKTAAQAMEEQRRKRHELEAHALGLAESYVKYFFERIYIKLRLRTQGHAIGNGFRKGYAICGCAAARQKRHEDAICQDQRSKLNRFEEISHLCSCC